MSRPGEKITRKSILMQKKIKEMDKNEVSSKSLLANVLDIDDNFCATTIAPSINGNHPSHTKPPLLNGCFTRYVTTNLHLGFQIKQNLDSVFLFD